MLRRRIRLLFLSSVLVAGMRANEVSISIRNGPNFPIARALKKNRYKLLSVGLGAVCGYLLYRMYMKKVNGTYRVAFEVTKEDSKKLKNLAVIYGLSEQKLLERMLREFLRGQFQ